jgi:hypothetical protein
MMVPSSYPIATLSQETYTWYYQNCELIWCRGDKDRTQGVISDNIPKDIQKLDAQVKLQ